MYTLRQKTASRARLRRKNLKALCDLSETKVRLNPDQLTTLIKNSPDPETAARAVLSRISPCPEVLERKWRQLVKEFWSSQHPHVPLIPHLNLTTDDVAGVIALRDAVALLNVVRDRPPLLVSEGKEWLLSSEDAYHLAGSLPSARSRVLIQLENEWQYPYLRRMRETLQALRLIRRVKNRLYIVKSRYHRFAGLPDIHKFYLLWHAEAYHLDWDQFSGIWGDFLRVVQSYLHLLWDIGEDALPDMPRDVRQWNQDVCDSFSPLWEQAGLLEQPVGHKGLLSAIRVQSLPSALTQVILRDLLERYELIYGEGDVYAWSRLGINVTSAERTQELPCALDILL